MAFLRSNHYLCMPNLTSLQQAVEEIAKQAGRIITEHTLKASEISAKGKNDLVTAVDKKVEDFLKSKLLSILPEAGFLGEEFEAENQSNTWLWIVDPIDGTTNFVHGLPCYCVSICLAKAGNPIIGCIYDPNRDETFSARKGNGAFLNGKPIKVTGTNSLSESLIATGFPYKNFDYLKNYLSFFEHLLFETQGVRRLGSAALDLAYVACGRFDVFYEYGLSPWDVAAGVMLVEEAGGKNTNFSGENDVIFTKEIVASNSLVHDEFLSKIKKFF